MNRKPYSQILDSIARDHVAEHTDLAARILSQIEKRKSATMQPRMKMFVTAVLVLFVLMIVLASVPAVRAAIQRWFGYVPDIGLVSEGEMRVLAEPVTVTREGFVMTVEKVVADSAHTVVVYRVEGLTEENAFYGENNQGLPECSARKSLRFPGNELASTGQGQGGSFWGTGYESRDNYPVIPVEIDEVTFVLTCIDFSITGKAPENWEVPLRLIPASPEMTVFPVIEIATPVEVTSTPASQRREGFTGDGISLALERAVQMDDGYLLYATVRWENQEPYLLGAYDESAVRLLDANGQDVPFTFDYDALDSIEHVPGQEEFAIKTAPIQSAGPLTLILDSIFVWGPAEARLTFDPGPNPQRGQTWELNQLVDLGQGLSLRILRATYPTLEMGPQPPRASLSFDMESDTGVFSARLTDQEHPMAPVGGGGGAYALEPFSASVIWAGDFPEGPITVEITSIGISLPGPWEVQWTPPVSAAQASATPQPLACLNRQSWEQALTKPEALPAGLSGKLATADLVSSSDPHYEVFVLNLDGSDRKSVGPGDHPSLSPDGSRVVHDGPMIGSPSNGLYITDLVSGGTTLLPGTARGDGIPLWSPDGNQIAFTRGPSSGLIGAPGAYNIVVVNVDGSNPRQLTNGSNANHALAWMPDGNRILYSAANAGVTYLQTIDVRTGEVEQLSDVISAGAISPDLKRIVFKEMLPLDQYGLSVSNLDGSNRKLLADGNPYIATDPVWSPDGKWVLVSVDNSSTSESRLMLALIQVEACQIIPLPNLSGYTSSWLP